MGKVSVEKLVIDGSTYIREDLAVKIAPADLDGWTYCIVRTYSAGVFAGWVDLRKFSEKCVVRQARRIYYWEGAATLSQLAAEGTPKPDKCKFPVEVSEVFLTNAIEAIPCTLAAKNSIAAVPVWRA